MMLDIIQILISLPSSILAAILIKEKLSDGKKDD